MRRLSVCLCVLLSLLTASTSLPPSQRSSKVTRVRRAEVTLLESEFISPEEVRDALKLPASWLSPSQSLPVHSQSLPVHSQSRRWRRSQSAPSRGCHLGTCQLQNLASLLYRIGNKNGKEESNRNTADPRGYGKRRRRRRREERR
ncbi:UNVERIFIED_CONTAM: hypothetical protein FKN15_066282 [Acipenser sinensis]